MGDPVLAGRWAGYAKKLANFCIRDNVSQKTVIVEDGVQIHVQVANNDAKVTVQAGGGRYYQFVNSTPLPTLLSIARLGGVEFLLASAVAVKLPPILGPNGVPDWSKARAFATGSNVEGDDSSPWPTYPPVYPDGTTSHGMLTWLRGADMVTYYPEPVFVGLTSTASRRLLYSWSSVEGQVRMANALSPFYAFLAGDVDYDASPGMMTGSRTFPWQSPDADWPHDACIVTVDGGDLGKRSFIVLADAFGEFHCWPMGAPKDFSLADDKPQYATQAYRANIPPANAKSVIPPYPGWVKRPAKKFRDHATETPIQSTDPRNVVRFHPHGTKAVVTAIDRRPVNWSVHHQQGREPETSFPAKIADLLQLGGDPDHKVDPALDVPGWCEFGLSISFGEDIDDFDFSMSLLGEELASGTTWPVAAAYLGPVPGKTWADRGVTASVGDLVVAYLNLTLPEVSRTTVARHLGWHGVFQQYCSHGWLSIQNRTVGNAVIKSIPLFQTDPLDFEGRTTIPFPLDKSNFIVHLELATLTWATVSAVQDYALGADSVGTKSGIGGVDVNVHPQRVTMGMGIETVVYGQSVRRKSVGALNSFTWIDGFSPLNPAFPVDETGTWYIRISGLAGDFDAGQNNWLLDKATYHLGSALAERRAEEGNNDWLPADKAEFMTITDKLLEDKRNYPPYDEAEPRFVGPHSVIATWHKKYTSAYWLIIVDELWNIFQDAVVRKNAGDFQVLTSREAYYTGVVTSVPKMLDNNIKIAFTIPSSVYWPRVYDSEIGFMAYGTVWVRAANRILNRFPVKVLDNGYYAGALSVIFHTSPVANTVAYKSVASGMFHAAGNPFDDTKDISTWLFANYASIVPDIQVFGKLFTDDFICHINGGDERTHLGFYNEAYQHNYNYVDYTYIGTTEIENGNIIHYIENIVKLDGISYKNPVDTINALFGMYTFSTNPYVPRLNGGMQMT